MLTYGYGIPLPLGLAILVSSFLIFPLNERATNAKQVQLMTGLMPSKILIRHPRFEFDVMTRCVLVVQPHLGPDYVPHLRIHHVHPHPQSG